MSTESQFQPLSASHIAVLCLVVIVPVALSIAARRGGERTTKIICVSFATLMFVNVVVHWIYRLAEVGIEEFVQRHLPLHSAASRRLPSW
ncbi:MAG: hypothetical protein OXH68_07520 [Gammaproteobacteria bacterium]|nr:hypothetical protein [Gammaproteobacteria bacterium]